MKITVDTNVLVRAVVQDDPLQAQQATAVLMGASLIAVATPTLCQLVWVLGNWLGGETFVSFDKKAVAQLTVQG